MQTRTIEANYSKQGDQVRGHCAEFDLEVIADTYPEAKDKMQTLIVEQGKSGFINEATQTMKRNTLDYIMGRSKELTAPEKWQLVVRHITDWEE